MKKQKSKKSDVRTQFPIRLNKEELEKIADAAREAGLPVSTWARMVLLKEAGRS